MHFFSRVENFWRASRTADKDDVDFGPVDEGDDECHFRAIAFTPIHYSRNQLLERCRPSAWSNDD